MIITFLIAHWIEIFGVITGAGSVYYLARDKGKPGWILGIINSVFFMILFAQQLLFADFTLNAYYLVTSALGLYWWMRGSKKKTLPITHLSRKGWIWVAVIAILGTAAFGTFLGSMTIAQFVYIDSFTTVLSFIGQWLLAKRVFDNWYIWIAADVIDIGLYAWKGLIFVTIMTAVYMVLCVMGIMKWRKDEALEKSETLEVPAPTFAGKLVEGAVG
jgi:nicotinamide mononucleotide transporter